MTVGLFRNRKVLQEVAALIRKKMNEDRHKLSAGKCRRRFLVSRSIRYIRDIREGSLGRGAKRRWVVEGPPICLRPFIAERCLAYVRRPAQGLCY